MSYLNDDQIAQLLRPINPRRVSQRDGMSYLESYDCRAHMDRVFGFARWSADLTDLALLFETAGEKTKDNRTWRTYSVGYRATVRLTVCAPDGTVLATYTEAATGDASNFPETKRADAHDFAIKTAESQAFKRCAINLGTQFGLSLYQNGATNDIVGRTLVSAVERSADPVDEHVAEVVPEGVTPPAAPDNHVQSQPPAETPEDAREERVKELRGKFLNGSGKSEISMASGLMLRDGLGGALTDDGEGNVLTLAALADKALKRVTARSRASA